MPSRPGGLVAHADINLAGTPPGVEVHLRRSGEARVEQESSSLRVGERCVLPLASKPTASFPSSTRCRGSVSLAMRGSTCPSTARSPSPPDYDAARRRDLRRLCERYRLMVANLATSTVAALGLGRYPWAPLGHRRYVAARSVRRLPERRTLHVRP